MDKGKQTKFADKGRESPDRRKHENLYRPKLDEFWLDGDGIDRQVLQSSVSRFLGPEATSRPFDLNV